MVHDWNSDERLSFLAPVSTPGFVRGREVLFFPISVRMAFRLKLVARPIAAALSDLFLDTERTAKQTFKNYGPEATETIIDAQTEPMIEAITNRQRNAVTSLVDALLDEKNKLLLADLIMDSARELFPASMRSTEGDQRFIEALDAPAAVDFLIGVVNANKAIFSPFKGLLPKTALDAARRKLGMEPGEATAAANGTTNGKTVGASSPRLSGSGSRNKSRK